MTIQRTRKLLGLEELSDQEVQAFIAESSRACRELLHIIVNKKDRIDQIDRKN